MDTQQTVTVRKAQAIPGVEIEDACLVFSGQIPSFDDDWRLRCEGEFLADAEKIVDLLRSKLPGGTYDRVFAVMAKHVASGLLVTTTDPLAEIGR